MRPVVARESECRDLIRFSEAGVVAPVTEDAAQAAREPRRCIAAAGGEYKQRDCA